MQSTKTMNRMKTAAVVLATTFATIGPLGSNALAQDKGWSLGKKPGAASTTAQPTAKPAAPATGGAWAPKNKPSGTSAAPPATSPGAKPEATPAAQADKTIPLAKFEEFRVKTNKTLDAAEAQSRILNQRYQKSKKSADSLNTVANNLKARVDTLMSKSDSLLTLSTKVKAQADSSRAAWENALNNSHEQLYNRFGPYRRNQTINGQ